MRWKIAGKFFYSQRRIDRTKWKDLKDCIDLIPLQLIRSMAVNGKRDRFTYCPNCSSIIKIPHHSLTSIEVHISLLQCRSGLLRVIPTLSHDRCHLLLQGMLQEFATHSTRLLLLFATSNLLLPHLGTFLSSSRLPLLPCFPLWSSESKHPVTASLL